VLEAEPGQPTLDAPNIFHGGIERSFYGNVLPDYHVNLGWSSYAAMWLSAVPLTIPDHFIPMRATGAVRAAFERQAAKNWEAFLAARARELRPVGSLVIVLAGRDDIG
jgi:hypothetical protein